jgi:hypothetical protein
MGFSPENTIGLEGILTKRINSNIRAGFTLNWRVRAE